MILYNILFRAKAIKPTRYVRINDFGLLLYLNVNNNDDNKNMKTEKQRGK